MYCSTSMWLLLGVIALWHSSAWGEVYVDYPEVGLSYKYHSKKATWSKAVEICLSENATLAVPKNEKEHNIVVDQFVKGRNSNKDQYMYAFIGIHDLFNSREYVTIHDKSDVYINWDYDQPNDISRKEHCLTLKCNGKVHDHQCLIEMNFICEKPILFTNEFCVSQDPAYAYIPNTGTCLKKHSTTLPWKQARRVCEKEGGHLVIVDSLDKQNYLTDNMTESSILVGFHDMFEEGKYVTVKAELQNKLDVTWSSKDESVAKNCGGLTKAGLVTWPCDVPAAFYCQTPANTKFRLAINPRFNYEK